VNPDVLLCPTPWIWETWLQHWRHAASQVTSVVDFPFAVPNAGFNAFRARDYTGLNFLANTDFRPAGCNASYWENQALANRQRIYNEHVSGQREPLRVHHYPQRNWEAYKGILERCERMLTVPGNACTINQQMTECLAAGTIPVIHVENDAALAHFTAYGFDPGVNCEMPGVYTGGAPTRAAVLELAHRHDYVVRMEQLVNIINTTQVKKQNAERLRHQIEQCIAQVQ